MANRQTKGFPFVWERKIMKPQPSPRCGAPQTHHPVFTSASASLCNYKGFIEVNFTISYQISCESPTKNSTNKAFRILNACKDVSEITFRIHKQICYTWKTRTISRPTVDLMLKIRVLPRWAARTWGGHTSSWRYLALWFICLSANRQFEKTCRLPFNLTRRRLRGVSAVNRTKHLQRVFAMQLEIINTTFFPVED